MPIGRRGEPDPRLRRPEPRGRGRPPPRGPAGHPLQDGDRLLAGPAPPQGPSGPWSAHPDQRSYPQGSQADRCRQEEGAQVMAKPKPGGRRPRKRERRNVSHGVAHIKSSFNNTIISITDLEGNVLSWASAGNDGFKGSRKSPPSAPPLAAEEAPPGAAEHGVAPGGGPGE